LWNRTRPVIITAVLEKMSMRLMIFILAAVVVALLTGGNAAGQQRLPDVAPPAFVPPDAAQVPFDTSNVVPSPFISPESSSPVAMPLDVAPSQADPPQGSSVQIAPPVGSDRATGGGEVVTSPGPAVGGPAGGMSGMGIGGSGRGGMGMGPMGAGWPGAGGPGYGATWYPSRPVSPSSSDAELGLLQQSFSVALPMWNDCGDVVIFSTGVRNSMFFTDAVLPDSHRPFPSELWNVNFGSLYSHRFNNGWMGGLGINFGSASDQPFHSINEMNLGFFSYLQVPVRNDRDAWRFSLMYSPVGNLNFPIPGVAYLWNPSDAFHASIGLPFTRSIVTTVWARTRLATCATN
jgi:hypothetical protein